MFATFHDKIQWQLVKCQDKTFFALFQQFGSMFTELCWICFRIQWIFAARNLFCKKPSNRLEIPTLIFCRLLGSKFQACFGKKTLLARKAAALRSLAVRISAGREVISIWTAVKEADKGKADRRELEKVPAAVGSG